MSSSRLQLTSHLKHNQEGIIRFEDCDSDGLTSPVKQKNATESERSNGNPCNEFKKGSLSFESLYYNQSVMKPLSEERSTDPQRTFMQKWNKMFLISCVFAMALDPLFFYIPVIDAKKQCLKLDANLEIFACFLRTITDLFYMLHIILQFHTGFISPSSPVLGRGARRYLSSNFIIDLLSILPFPQIAVLVIIPRLMGGGLITSRGLLKLVIFTQYVPRLVRIYPLYMKATRTSGIITETAWAGAASNLFLYMLSSHVFGAVWYMFSIDRQGTCWKKSCMGEGCHHLSLYCNDNAKGNYAFNNTYCNPVNPDQIADSSAFNFGLFYDALNSEVVQSTQFLEKLCYCFWWGFRNLSSLGQNLKTSTFIWENLFSTLISVAGLVLISLFIANMQRYLQSITGRLEEMRKRRQDTEQWVSCRLLPQELRERIRRYDQHRWKVTRGVDEESIICNLPRDLRRDVKRHLCLPFLMRVPSFAIVDQQLKDAMCDRLKPVHYTENSFITCEGDPVNEMIFIIRGNALTMNTNGGENGIFNSVFLKPGDFCGEALLAWAVDPKSLSNLPISTTTVLSQTEVEAFMLTPDDLKFMALQMNRFNSKQLRHKFRFYSQQWRTWAAFAIQATWRTYCRKKLKKSLQETGQMHFCKR